MAYLQDLREKAGKAVADARSIQDKAKTEKRELTADEEKQVDGFLAEYDRLDGEITTQEKRDARSAKLEAAGRAMEERGKRKSEPQNPGNGGGRRAHEDNGDVVLEHRGVELRFGKDSPVARRCTDDYQRDFRDVLRGVEQRNLQSTIDVSGGYLITPEQMAVGILKELDDEVFIRKISTAIPVPTAQTLGIRTRTNKASTFQRGSELSDSTDDTSLKFGNKVLKPDYVTGSILVSRDLLRSAFMDPMAIVREELARDAGELEEREFLTGNGTNEPMGVFTASADGITTARDVSTGNTSTEIQWDGLIEALDNLKGKYQANATWMFHRNALTKIRKLKDGSGNYIWNPITREGMPASILGRPYILSEWVPNTFTTGQYVGIVGDFSHYVIADALEFELLVLDQTKARQNQIEVIVRRKYDAMPRLAEAFSRVKLA
ncbi:MAG: phage major capsid protein [Phycisphaerales bacterium]|nr:phage major capsid protein [Phycisphaerales bacterium]